MTYLNKQYLFLICKCLVVISIDLGVTNAGLQSPCPGVFEYQYDHTNTLSGFIQLPSLNSYSNIIRLDVQISVGNTVQGFNGNILLTTPRTRVLKDLIQKRPLQYTLYFPYFAKIPPTITKILVNGIQICYGSPIDRNLVTVVTTINLQHTLTLNIPPVTGSNVGSRPDLSFVDETVIQSPPHDFGSDPKPVKYPININLEPPKHPSKVYFNNQNNKFDTPTSTYWQNLNPTNHRQSINTYFYSDPTDEQVSNNPYFQNQNTRDQTSSSYPQFQNQNPTNQKGVINPYFHNRNPTNQKGVINPYFQNRNPTDQQSSSNPYFQNQNPTNQKGSSNPFFAYQNPSLPVYYNFPESDSSLAPNYQNIPFFSNSNTNWLQPTQIVTTKPNTNVYFLPTQPSKEPEAGNLPTVESNLVQRRFSNICGISGSTNALLVNGNKVLKGLHPWVAPLFMQNDGGLKFMCGTTLVSEKHVITAGHCVRNKQKQYQPEKLWVFLGRENIERWSNDGAQIIQAQSTHVHPDYQSGTSDADIAIIVLSEVAQFSNQIKPACLWTGDHNAKLIVEKLGTVIGWGRDETGRASTPEAKRLTFPAVSEEDCLRSNPGFREITSNRTFCAGYRNNSGPCNGDSGSGFLMSKDGRWTLRGIVSMSLLRDDGDCDLKQYIVFTDVAKYSDWILSFLQ